MLSASARASARSDSSEPCGGSVAAGRSRDRHRDGEVLLHVHRRGVQPRHEGGARRGVERAAAILDEPRARLLGDRGPDLLVAWRHLTHPRRAMRRRQWPSAWARYFLTMCVDSPRRSAISW